MERILAVIDHVRGDGARLLTGGSRLGRGLEGGRAGIEEMLQRENVSVPP